jgi:23S rRNA pseudouridine1911/1915/1917 synthase
VQKAPLHTARPGVVHRLDKGTSGVIVVAKTPGAAEALSLQFAERKVEKIYWARVEGLPGSDSGSIRSTVGRDRHHPQRMSVTDPGRPSELEFKVLARSPKHGQSLVEVHPLTGRTHQIRVQLASIGHPLVGDATYGAVAGERPLLHALKLTITHPRTKKRLVFEAPLPKDFRKALKHLGFDAPPVKKVK